MGDPFNKLTEILLKTDFQNITYDNLKHILTFFISGRSHRVGIPRVIGDFKKPFITDVKYYPEKFKEINTKKFENKLENLGMSKEKTDFITDQFKKLLEITDEAIQYNAPNESDYKKFLKNSKDVVIYKGVNETDEQLVNTFGIGERLVRYKNKNKIREIDKMVTSINEANRSNNYEKLIQIIENVIDTYSEHNQPMLKIILEQLGFTVTNEDNTKTVGGDGDDDEKEKYLVGSLRDPIAKLNIGEVVKEVLSKRSVNDLDKKYKEFDENGETITLNKYTFGKGSLSYKYYRADRFFTRAYYILKNIATLKGDDVLQKLYFIYKYESSFISKNELLTEFGNSFDELITDTASERYKILKPKIIINKEEFVKKICVAGINYFNKLIYTTSRPELRYDNDIIKYLQDQPLAILINASTPTDAATPTDTATPTDSAKIKYLQLIIDIDLYFRDKQDFGSLKSKLITAHNSTQYKIKDLTKETQENINVILLDAILFLYKIYKNALNYLYGDDYLKPTEEQITSVNTTIDELKNDPNFYTTEKYKKLIEHIVYFKENNSIMPTTEKQQPSPTLKGGKKKKQNQNNLLIQDRIHFILLLFIIRTIVLFIATHNGYTKTLSQTTLLYFAIYVCFIILFVILANSNIVGFTELFYYLNTNTEDGRGLLRIILQLTCICALIPIPYIVKDKKELSNVTLYIFILASIVALIV